MNPYEGCPFATTIKKLNYKVIVNKFRVHIASQYQAIRTIVPYFKIICFVVKETFNMTLLCINKKLEIKKTSLIYFAFLEKVDD